jgi:tetratricopeptide (TPR) repeat protein
MGRVQETIRMRLSMFGAAALLAAVSAAPAAAQTSPAKPAAAAAGDATPQVKITISRKAGKAIAELQKAVDAKDIATIPAKLAAAQAVASTADDRYAIAQLHLKAALAAKDQEGMSKAVDALAATSLVPSDKLADVYTGLGVEFYNAKQFDRASASFQRAIALNPANLEPLILLSEAQNSLGQPAQAAATLQKVIKQTLASGKKPEEKVYKRALAMAYGAESANSADFAQQWVAAYPSADSWTNAIAIYRNTAHPDFAGTLDLLRLMRAVGALTRPEDYVRYVAIARDQNNFAEAQAVLDEGLAAKKIEASNPLAAEINAKPKPSLEDLAGAAKTAPSGRTLMGIGDRYFGAGEYAKAAETYRQAMAKGGDANLANLHLGMALARAGDKAGATAALNAVTGTGAGIAKYWLLYVQQHG